MQCVKMGPLKTARLVALLASVPLSIIATPSTCAAILRVQAGVTNQTPDGLSWTNAFPGVIEALAVAQAGDEIWVAAGTYPGGFTLAGGIALYGGFAGNEEARGQRDFNLNLSRLDGARRTNVIAVASGAGPETRLDGFIVQHGLANGTGVRGSGGGVRVINADPVLANNQFLSNNCIRTGGAVYLEGSATLLTSNYFGFNGTESTVRDGGGLAVTNSSPRIESNSFVGNRGRDGGAAHFATSTGFLVRNSLLDNTATGNGGGVFFSSASPQVTHNRFLGNSAASLGGGVALVGGSAPLLFNNVFARNVAATGSANVAGGGGVSADATSQPNLLNNTLVLNQGPVGGLLLSNRNASVVNNIIAFGSTGVGGTTPFRFQTNNVFGNGRNYVDLPDATGTGGNLSVDPKFAGDLNLAVINLLPDSPCRDVGNGDLVPPASADLDGQPRIQGANVDLGADETDGVTTYFLPTVVRVAPSGDDRQDGGAWTQPKQTVQAAIELAGRRGGEVWVMGGTYAGELTLRPFTSLYGGFAGTETNRLQRNFRQQQTVLDGGGAARVLRLPNLMFDEAVDGFTISNGQALAGAGIFSDGNVRIVNNRFEDNVAVPAATTAQARGGAALYLNGGDPFVANNTFLRNQAASRLSTLSADGGAIKVAAGNPTIANNLFRMNSVTNSAANGLARGGAIVIVGTATPRVINNTFLQNSATALTRTTTYEHGGALACEGTVNTNAPAPLLVNNLIAYNTSGVSAHGQHPRLFNNLVWGSIGPDFLDLPDPTGQGGNISASPGLTGPYGDPHLTSSSLARDAGDDTAVRPEWLDLDGRPRIVGDAPDIGADEFDGTTYQISPRVFYVRPNGADTNDGRSWTAAKQTVGAALAAAALDGGEVWVQAGSYRERVRVDLFTYLFGGFKGDETTRAARNWREQPTILDGGADPANPVAGVTLVTVTGTDAYAAVDGLTIQNGASQIGGGLHITGSPMIAHNLIRSNVAISTSANAVAAGGAIYCNRGMPTLLDNVFIANRAVNTLRATNSLGGAIYLFTPSGDLPSIFNNTLLDNHAGMGGGVFMRPGSSAHIANNIVAFGSSGLIADSPTNSTVLRNNCVFGNTGNDYLNLDPDAGSLAADPRLVDWQAGNYRLRADSPCLDAGDAGIAVGSLDFFAEPRRSGRAPDIGADEFSEPATADFALAISQPLDGQFFVAPATVFLDPAITGGTTRPAYIEYLANDQMVAVGATEPFYAFSSELPIGDYQLLARAVTASGSMVTSAPVAINVVLSPVNQPPTVRFTSPTNNQQFVPPANVRVSFTWTKPGGRVTRWDLFTNGVFSASNPDVPSTATSATLVYSNLTTGNYEFTAIVTDNVGTTGTNRVSFVMLRGNPDPSVPQPPTLRADGTLQIEFSAPTSDADYVLEKTLNLTAWTPVSTNRGGAPIQIVVPVNPSTVLEAYRTRAYYP